MMEFIKTRRLRNLVNYHRDRVIKIESSSDGSSSDFLGEDSEQEKEKEDEDFEQMSSIESDDDEQEVKDKQKKIEDLLLRYMRANWKEGRISKMSDLFEFSLIHGMAIDKSGRHKMVKDLFAKIK